MSLDREINTDDYLQGEELSRYTTLLERRSEEDTIRVLKDCKKKYNERISDIPSRIDELERQKVEVVDLEENKAKEKELLATKASLLEQINQAQNGGAVSQIKIKINELKAEQSEFVREFSDEQYQKTRSKREEIQVKINALQERIDSIQALKIKLTTAADAASIQIDQKALAKNNNDDVLNKINVELIKWQGLSAPEKGEPGTCALCEQPLDVEKHETNHLKAVEEFNTNKAENIKRLTSQRTKHREEGQRYNSEFDELVKKHENLIAERAKAQGTINQIEAQIQKLTDARNELRNGLPIAEDQEQYKALSEQIKTLEAKVPDLQAATQETVDTYRDDLSKVEAQLDAIKENGYAHQNNTKLNERITELQAERKKHALALEEVEADLFFLEEVERKRANHITSKVNAKFQYVTWRLFEEQINGGLKPTCDALYKGVSYGGGLNSAGKIQAGLDIINTLSQHYGTRVPVILDNRESTSWIPDTDLQVISLFVKKGQKSLDINYTSKKQF